MKPALRRPGTAPVRPKKSVTLSRFDEVSTLVRTPAEHLNDTNIALDIIIHMLQSTVGSVLASGEEDFSGLGGKVKEPRVGRKSTLHKITMALGYDTSDTVNAAAWAYYERHKHMTMAEFIKMHIPYKRTITEEEPGLKTRTHGLKYMYCIFLIRIALNGWISFNQCKHQCTTEIMYQHKLYNIVLQRKHKDLQKLCFDSSHVIEDALDIDDIRLFDIMIQQASDGRCSLVFPKDKKSQRFFFFGCWNRDNCKDHDYRAAVIESIKNVGDSKFDFGVIAGDNIYPHKTSATSAASATSATSAAKPIKTYWQTTVDYAFALLKSIVVNDIYATVGNHDVVKESILLAQLNNEVIYMHENVYSVVPTRYLRIICIDTNLLGAGTSIPKFYSMSKHSIQLIQDFVVVPSGKKMLEWLENELIKPFTEKMWTVVVGHDPLVTVKDKEGENKGYKITAVNDVSRLMDLISARPRCMYMCADVHNFQAWNIQHNGKTFPMIVAGTGGADPDKALTTLGDYTSDINAALTAQFAPSTFNLVASCAPYGFCDVNCTKSWRGASYDTFSINYKPLPGCGTPEGDPVRLTVDASTNTIVVRVKDTKTRPPSIPACAVKDTDPTLCTNPKDELKGGRGRRQRR